MSNSGTKVGVVSNGELDGDGNSPVMVKSVQVGAEWAAGVVVVVVSRGCGAGIIIRVTTCVNVGRGGCRQRSFSDPGSSRHQTSCRRFEVREYGSDGVIVPQSPLAEVAVTRGVCVLGSLENMAMWALSERVVDSRTPH